MADQVLKIRLYARDPGIRGPVHTLGSGYTPEHGGTWDSGRMSNFDCKLYILDISVNSCIYMICSSKFGRPGNWSGSPGDLVSGPWGLIPVPRDGVQSGSGAGPRALGFTLIAPRISGLPD